MTSEKITNYYQRNHPNNSYKLLSEKLSKQFLQTFITEVIPKNAFKLLPEKSFQTILTNFYHRSNFKQCLQTISNILSIYCHRNHSKQFLQTFIEEVIQNNAFRLLPEKSFQTILTNFYHIILIRFLDNDILITINLIWVILLRLSIKQVI